jgi:hypothetical protein
LRGGLQLVVELLGDALTELGQQRLDVHPGLDDLEHGAEPGELVEVGEERLPRARVLDLHGDRLARLPHRPVDLTDRGGGGRGVVERGEPLPPVGAELAGQHLVDRGRRQRRRRLLELGERLAVRAGQVFGQGGLEDRQRLTELHGAALELPQDAEQLLGRALLDLGRDHVRGHAGDPLAEAEHRPPGEPKGQRGEFGGAGYGPAGDVAHQIIVTDRTAQPPVRESVELSGLHYAPCS